MGLMGMRSTSRNANTTIVSRPARENHKQPSNLSLGGISVGSYTIFNDSSTSGAGMEYVTPPSKRKGRFFDLSALSGGLGTGDDENSRGDGLRLAHGHLRRVHSTDSTRSRKSSMTGRARWRDHFAVNRKDKPGGATRTGTQSALGHHEDRADNNIGAYALGLARHVGGHQHAQARPMRPAMGRPSREGAVGVGVARALSWRSRDEQPLDRSRFEFKAVKRKGSSGGFKDWLGGLKGGKQDGGGGGRRGGNWL